MYVKLDRDHIDTEIRCYLKKLLEIRAPIRRAAEIKDIYGVLKFIKRQPLEAGPYPNVSLFESCNRIFSDLVILFGVKRLLCELNSKFPFTEYHVALGTEQGIDIKAQNAEVSLAGEAFSVAQTFFQTKKLSALKIVVKSGADYKMLLFNSDAVSNPVRYDLKKERDVYYLVINVDKYLSEFHFGISSYG